MKFLVKDIIDADQNFSFDFKYDMEELIKSSNHDVIKAGIVNVSGRAYVVLNNEFVFDITVSTSLIIKCSVTLEDVPYELKYRGTEVFAYNKIDEDTNIIKGDSISIQEIVEDYVICNIPMKVVKPGYENKDNSQLDSVTDDSPFASLKNLFK